MTRGIYKIINVVNNKFYVGSAVDLKRRKARHFSELRIGKHNNRHLQAAWNKYGEQAFVFVVIEEAAADTDLLAAENVWLHAHVGKEYCYNIGIDATAPMRGMGGKHSPTWGYKHTPENLEKIGVASKARVQTDAEKEKRRATMRGKPQPTVVRAKISHALSGEGNFWYGKERSDEFKTKIRKAVVVTDQTGKETVYESIQALREALQIKPPTVNRALKSGAPLARGPHTGLSFKYLAPPTDS